MIAFYFISLFLFVYIDQHGKYLNIFDVVLLSAAGMFVLLIVFVIIMSIIDQGRKYFPINPFTKYEKEIHHEHSRTGSQMQKIARAERL